MLHLPGYAFFFFKNNKGGVGILVFLFNVLLFLLFMSLFLSKI